MRANAKAIDAMALLVQTEDRLLVDVVRCDNGQLAKPGHLKAGGHRLEGVARQHRQVGQVTGVDANADRPEALVVERQRHGAEVQQAAPVVRLVRLDRWGGND